MEAFLNWGSLNSRWLCLVPNWHETIQYTPKTHAFLSSALFFTDSFSLLIHFRFFVGIQICVEIFLWHLHSTIGFSFLEFQFFVHCYSSAEWGLCYFFSCFLFPCLVNLNLEKSKLISSQTHPRQMMKATGGNLWAAAREKRSLWSSGPNDVGVVDSSSKFKEKEDKRNLNDSFL